MEVKWIRRATSDQKYRRISYSFVIAMSHLSTNSRPQNQEPFPSESNIQGFRRACSQAIKLPIYDQGLILENSNTHESFSSKLLNDELSVIAGSNALPSRRSRCSYINDHHILPEDIQKHPYVQQLLQRVITLEMEYTQLEDKHKRACNDWSEEQERREKANKNLQKELNLAKKTAVFCEEHIKKIMKTISTTKQSQNPMHKSTTPKPIRKIARENSPIQVSKKKSNEKENHNFAETKICGIRNKSPSRRKMLQFLRNEPAKETTKQHMEKSLSGKGHQELVDKHMVTTMPSPRRPHNNSLSARKQAATSSINHEYFNPHEHFAAIEGAYGRKKSPRRGGVTFANKFGC